MIHQGQEALVQVLDPVRAQETQVLEVELVLVEDLVLAEVVELAEVKVQELAQELEMELV